MHNFIYFSQILKVIIGLISNKQHYIIIGILIIVCGLLLFISNNYLGGYLSSAHHLGKEIWSVNDRLYEWRMSETPPFMYRMLFPFLVKSTFQNISGIPNNTVFYYTYIFWSYLSFAFAAISFYVLALTISKDKKFILLCFILFFTASPILLSHTLPVHTREDFLGYGLLCLGLYAMAKQKIFALIFIMVLGVLCRETLLLLPFIFLFYSNFPISLIKKVLLSGIPFLIFILIRFFLGKMEYDVWLGLKWNMNNLSQVLIFFFLSFHILWIVSYLAFKNKEYGNINNQTFTILRMSFFPVFMLVLLTTFIFGIFNEIRLLFILFPWVILSSSLWFFQNYKNLYKTILILKYQLYYSIVIITSLIMMAVFHIYIKKIEVLFSNPAYVKIWGFIFLVYIVFTCLLLPHMKNSYFLLSKNKTI